MPNQPGSVWVIAEKSREKIAEVTLELLGKAREIAARRGSPLTTAVLPGKDAGLSAAELIAHGADQVILIEDPRLEPYQNDTCALVLEELIKRHRPEIVLFGASYRGSELSATVAARLQTGLSAHCIDLKVDDRKGLVQVVPAFGGIVYSEILCPEARPQMASVKPGVFSKPARDAARTGTVLKEKATVLEGYQSPLKAVRVVQRQPPELPLEKAETIVVGGWGVGPDMWDYLEQIAGELEGAVGCTRPALDEGWTRGEHTMIGTSGKTVRPRVYMGFGVSGSAHHVVGMKDSGIVINVNNDPEAPVFQVSDYSVIADAGVILPVLLEKIKEHKGI